MSEPRPTAASYTARPSGELGTTWASEDIEAITGFPPSRFVDDPGFWTSRLHPEDRERVLGEFAALLRGATETEYRWQCADGTYRWFADRAILKRDAAGRPVEIIGSWQDISERKRAEDNLRLSQSSLPVLMEQAADGILIADQQGRFVDANPVVCELLGYTREELLRIHVRDTYALEEVDVADRRLAELHARKPLRFERRLRRKDGTFVPVEINAKMLADGRTQAIVRDVTERQRAEQELRQARLLAESADHARSAFLASMSHELRTPLNAIIGFSELLEDQTGGPLTERQQKYVRNILLSGRHLLDLITGVLDLTLVEAGHLALQLKQFEVNEALRGMHSLVGALAEKKRLTLTLDVEDSLPAITADEPKFKQIVYHLLSNAIKFTAEGGRVRLGARRTSDGLEVAVADTGAGIAPDVRERLFAPFERADDSSARAEQGPGLGLALTRKLVELHGGRISVESEVGRGSTFTFLLPFAPTPRRRTSPTPGVVAGTPGRPCVLVVEDDPQLSELLADYLTQAGYAVARASTSADAIALARELRPAAITLDLALPDGDGRDVLGLLRSAPETRNIPVVVVSVIDRRGTGATPGGTSGWLVKPVNREALLAVMRRVVPEHASPPATPDAS